MRIPIIAGNWKMNNTVPESVRLVGDIRDRLTDPGGVEVVVCPPFVSLPKVAEMLMGSTIAVGAQNMYFEEKGAYTGEVSPRMLGGICQYVILGHSERRAVFGEDDGMVNRKVRSAVASGLRPILCVGETLEENEAGRTEQVVTRQVRMGMEGLNSINDLVIAYEPVWAIGTGRAATAKQANETIALIREVVGGILGPSAADLRILYGGSANAANIAEFAGQPDVDGALVGGASLKADEFVRMVEAVAAAKRA